MSGMSGMDMGDSGSMDMSVPALRTKGFTTTASDRSAANEMENMYNTFTINENASGNTMLDAKPGQTVRLRLVNAGNMTHLMTIVGVPFKVVAIDGQDISNPTPIEGQLLPIDAAERYDVEFTMPKSGSVQLVSGDHSMASRMGLHATIGDQQMNSSSMNNMSMSNMPNVSNEPWFDFTNYGSGNVEKKPVFSINQHFDKTFNMTLGTAMNKENMVYTINGKAYPDVPPFVVNTGDTVKIHIENNTDMIHPMHLHGHDFQVLTRDGKPVMGSPIYMDTLAVLPGETYDIAFKADNPGLWMFHCHDLHHAAAGMDMILEYAGVKDPYDMKDMSE
jgi:FtsP/CotA-like multicopper oxidase with cupredoxin domain